jgi:hypothetical protein
MSGLGSVITASGAFVTLIFAVSALISKLHGVKRLDAAEATLIIVAMASFLLSTIYAVLANQAEDYGAIKQETLNSALEEPTQSIARELLNQTEQLIKRYRDINNLKAIRLKNAILCQIVALALLVAAIIVIASLSGLP